MCLLKYNDFLHSDFFEFFNLEEIRTEKIERLDSRPFTIFHFKPGSFTEFIDITVQIDDPGGDITKADLYLAREWIGNEEHVNMLANDIAKSFISTFLKTSDSLEGDTYINAIWSARGTKDIVVHLVDKEEGKIAAPLAIAMMEVYKGQKLCIDVKFSKCLVGLENELRDGRDVLHAYITTTEEPRSS